MTRHAARVSDPHTCPKCADGPIKAEGCGTVRVGNQPAAREGDEAECGGGIDKLTEGERSVLIGGRPAARVGDATAAGGSIVKGLASVWIGKERPSAEASKPPAQKDAAGAQGEAKPGASGQGEASKATKGAPAPGNGEPKSYSCQIKDKDALFRAGMEDDERGTRLVLSRTSQSATDTRGVLTIVRNGQVVESLCTLERNGPDSTVEDSKLRIPAGTYSVHRCEPWECSHAPRRFVIEGDGLGERDLVRFHSGNTFEDTEGCVLLGLEMNDAGIRGGTSRPAIDILRRALPKGETATLTIENNFDAAPSGPSP